MGIPYNKYIQFLRSSKKKRRQLACFVTALSVFVSGGVFWQLRGIGTAMVDENLPNADDSGEAITLTPLNASELETQDVWEATLPPLTDIAGENLARIAESQLGYSESSVNFVHAEDGETHNGYTRYGAWYGNPYGEWNTMFTYFCLNYAGVSSDHIPYGSGCWAWSLELDKGGLVVPVTRGSPARGDILLIDSDLDGKADRSCIVTAVSDDDIPEISAIEGDVDGEVAATAYLLDDEQLLGMVSLADIVPEPPILPDEPAEVDFSAESESGITVEAHADRGAFPPDTEMFVFDISQDEAVQAAADHFGDEAPDDIQAVAVDITFRSPDGEELEPAEDSQVRVSIVLPEEQSLTGGEFSLLHISDDGDVEEVADADVTAENADFITESFSVFVLVSNSTYIPSNRLTIVNGQFVNNSQSNPYIIYLYDEVNVFMSGAYHVNQDNNSRYVDAVKTQDPYTFNYRGNNYNGVMRTFKAVKTGKVQLATNENVFPVESLWLEIRKRSNIYVKTEYEYKNIDMVKEYLAGENGANTYNLLEVNGYVPNGPGQIVAEPTPRAYSITEGQEFEIYLDGISNYTLTNYNANYSPPNWNCELTPSDEQKIQSIECVDEHGPGVTALRFKGLKPGVTEIKFTDCGKSMWVRVLPNYEGFTHADMEIADGGKYTITSTSYDDEDNKTTIIKVYDAFVTYINSAKLLDENGAPLALRVPKKNDIPEHDEYEFTSNGAIDETKNVIGDYQQIGEPGGTQYELTSAFGRPKQYDINDVKSVEFDVNLTLKPYKQYTSVNDGPGTWENLTGADSTIQNYKKVYNEQGIVDALNKCPMTNGLDFTLRADAAIVDLKAKKQLIGSTPLVADQFEFELLDSVGNRVSTAKNDADGNIVFLNQMYTQPGTYKYTVHEIVPDGEARDPRMIYAEDQKIVVNVTEIQISGGEGITVLKAEMTTPPPTLTNYQTYTLPATGGTGELPYILFGSAMLASAITLLFIRRKKAAAR